jgi:DNA invertase Pin-like site-specific DNA recombinase
VRVSQVGGREGERFASPAEQRERIEAACEREGFQLVSVAEELDVSGGTPLAKRDGLRAAVEAIEAGDAQVLVAAYFDRLVRSLAVQGEVVSRVEAAGGSVLAVDVGAISAATAGQWLSGTVLGAMSEYVRRTARERSAGAQARAVARGVAPWDHVTLGYIRVDGVFRVDPDAAPAVAEAFDLRVGGATIREVREFLAVRGFALTYRRVQTLLSSRVVLGEIHFGELVNLEAHEPIVDRDVWLAAQRVRVSRGPQPQSDRPLARLGVLRCGTCGSRMVVGTAHYGRYPLYRCSPTSDCPQRVTVSAVKVEAVVVEAVRAVLANVEGAASAEGRQRKAAGAVERAQADLDAAVRAFAGLEDEAAARERLGELRAVRDRAREHLDRLGGFRSAVTIRIADWDLLTLDERRRLIRATVERVTVAPGRGDRIRVHLFGEDAPSG